MRYLFSLLVISSLFGLTSCKKECRCGIVGINTVDSTATYLYTSLKMVNGCSGNVKVLTQKDLPKDIDLNKVTAGDYLCLKKKW